MKHVGLPVALAIAIISARGARPLAAQLDVRETLIGIRPAGVRTYSVIASVSAAMRFAYLVSSSAGTAVVVDGVRGPFYEEILPSYMLSGEGVPRSYLVFSKNGERLGYLAKQGDRAFAVVDGIPGPPFDTVYWNSEYRGPFSPDSRHVVYLAKRAGKTMAVLDGIVGAAYDAVDDVAFSDDSRHLTYRAKRDGRWYLVIDRNEHPPSDSLAQRDSARSALSVRRGDRRDSVFANARRRGYDRILDATTGFSDDGSHVAFVAEERGKLFWVVDGIEQTHYDSLLLKAPFVRRDFGIAVLPNARVVYGARDGNDEFVVVGGREGRHYDRIYSMYVSPSGRLAYVARRGIQQYVVADTVAFPFDEINDELWLPDRIAIPARRDSSWYLLIDGILSPPYDSRVVIVRRADGRFAYVGSRGGKQFLVVDGVEARAYDEVSAPSFYHGGRHVVYPAMRRGKWVIVVDGQESPEYDEIVGLPSIEPGPDAFTALARRGTEDLRLTIRWPGR